jgi:hypothetical protein
VGINRRSVSKWLRKVLMGQRRTHSLSEYSPEANSRAVRFVVSSAEGAHFVSTDFADESEVIRDFETSITRAMAQDDSGQPTT